MCQGMEELQGQESQSLLAVLPPPPERLLHMDTLQAWGLSSAPQVLEETSSGMPRACGPITVNSQHSDWQPRRPIINTTY